MATQRAHGMNPEVEQLFEQAVGLDEKQREAFLAENCGNPEVRKEVELLLAHDQGAERFLRNVVLSEASAFHAVAISPGQRLGVYRVLSVLAQGGMGLVYLAERADGKFEQRVAIKVLQSDLDMPFLSKRIQQECRILASLEHPNIARVLDADITQEALPYFVMEYVDGQPIDRYCQRHKLSTRDRLRLLLPVCDALRLAHQNLIVHRDLKPDNILVTEQGVPKLLDFGIAKVLSEVPVSPQKNATRVLTPEYASPEQARGEPVTTATDIYSLGGVLYKLVTGSVPHQLADKSPLETVRAICDEGVRKPSELQRELAGDIDSILLKALHKDPQRRYRSVDQFAADIERLLEGKPVLARPDTIWYRSGKFVRRYFLALSMSAAMVLLLGAFALLQAVQLRQTRRERDRANRITDFMTTMFKVSDPSEARGSSVTAREILDKASSGIEAGLAQDPQAEAEMIHVMGTVYHHLGLYSRAETLMRRAVELRRRVLGPENADTLQSMDELVVILGAETHYSEEEKLARQVLEVRRRTLGPQNQDTLTSELSLAACLNSEGRFDEAAKLAREVLDARRKVLGSDNRDTLSAMQTLGRSLERKGQYPEAEQVFRTILEARRRVQGPDHPDTLMATENLGWILFREGRLGEAEGYLRQAVDTSRRVLGPEHPNALGYMLNFATDLSAEGRVGEAEELQRALLEVDRRVRPAAYQTIVAEESLGMSLLHEGQYVEAEKLLQEALESGRRTLGADHPAVLNISAEMGRVLTREGHSVEGENLERETLDSQRRILAPEHQDTMVTETYLADALLSQGRYAEAETLARQTLAVQLRVFGQHHADTLSTLQSLGIALARQHRYEEAKKLFNNTINQLSANPDINVPLAWYAYACVAVAANDRNGAIHHVREVLSRAPQFAVQMRADDDLKPLRGNARFKALVGNAPQKN